MRITYLINQYPKVSHTFIRREILALERLGFDIQRIALRGWDEKLIDLDDIAEQQKTSYVLKNGVFSLTKISRPFGVLKDTITGMFAAFAARASPIASSTLEKVMAVT